MGVKQSFIKLLKSRSRLHQYGDGYPFWKIWKTKSGKEKINSINDNKQSDEGMLLLYEGAVSKLYRTILSTLWKI